jgi:hypothetical protein
VKIFNTGLRRPGGKPFNREPSCEYLLKTAVIPLRRCCIYLDPGTFSKGDDRKHWLVDPEGCGSQNNVLNLALHEQAPSKSELTQLPNV